MQYKSYKDIDKELLADISTRLYAHEHPHRKALSLRYPALAPLILLMHKVIKYIKNKVNFNIRYSRQSEFYTNVIKRHQSPLRRRLGESDPVLNERKITNLRLAIAELNGVVVEPGRIFSLWQVLGNPTRKRGYVDGMLLSGGKVVEGVGGGLCQLSNLLYWTFLHADTKVVERFHHSVDVFPDSGRTLPFGSGATIMYNFIDLQVQNVSKQPIQLKLWLTESQLTCQLLSPRPTEVKYHIVERDHYFIKRAERYYRYNKIYRETLHNGEVIKTELVTTNFAPVMYKVDDEYITKHGFTVIDFTGMLHSSNAKE